MAVTTNVNISSLTRGKLSDNSYIPISVPLGITGATKESADLYSSRKYSVADLAAYINSCFKLDNIGIEAAKTQTYSLGSYTYTAAKSINTYINNVVYAYAKYLGSYYVSNAYSYIKTTYDAAFKVISDSINNFSIDTDQIDSDYYLWSSLPESGGTIHMAGSSRPNEPGLVISSQLQNIAKNITFDSNDTTNLLPKAGETTYGTVTLDYVDKIIKDTWHSLKLNFIDNKLVYSISQGRVIDDIFDPASYENNIGIDAPKATQTTYGLIKLSDYREIGKSKRGTTTYTTGSYSVSYNITRSYLNENIEGKDHNYEGLVTLSYINHLVRSTYHIPCFYVKGSVAGVSYGSGFERYPYNDGFDVTGHHTNYFNAKMDKVGFIINSYLKTYITKYVNDYIISGDVNEESVYTLTTFKDIQSIIRNVYHPLGISINSSTFGMSIYGWMIDPITYRGESQIIGKATETTYGTITENMYKTNAVDVINSKIVYETTPITATVEDDHINMYIQYSNSTNKKSLGRIDLPRVTDYNDDNIWAFCSYSDIYDIVKNILTNI